MTREEKILLAIERGMTCNPETGEVFGVRGRKITKNINGYIVLSIAKYNKRYTILCHQFIYYWVHKKCVDEIDHINGVKNDNRISNLREITHQQNQFNRRVKGYYWHKRDKKYISRIILDRKTIYIGSFNTEEDAHNAYLNAKKTYHII